jgi:hypothetical protein
MKSLARDGDSETGGRAPGAPAGAAFAEPAGPASGEPGGVLGELEGLVVMVKNPTARH